MSESVREVKKPRYSYSRATCFYHCKYEYYLGYIIDDDSQYLREGNYYAEEGSFVHEILAMIFSGQLRAEDGLQYYIDNHESNVFYKVKKSIMKNNMEKIMNYFSDLDLGWMKDYEILGVEKKVTFKLGKNDFIGFIDLLLRDKRDGRIVVIDHKSAEYPFKRNGELKKKLEKSFESYKKQMYLYCRAVYLEYGEYPKEITWNIFKDGGKMATIPFVMSEYEEAMKWFEDTIEIIEQEENFEPSEDYFYCNEICNFRNSCDYHLLTKGGKYK